MKKLFYLCVMALAFIISACGATSDSIDKAYDLVENKGEAVEVYKCLTSSTIDCNNLSVEQLAKLNLCIQYCNTSSWGQASTGDIDMNKLSELLGQVTECQKNFTPEQRARYMDAFKELMKR